MEDARFLLQDVFFADGARREDGRVAAALDVEEADVRPSGCGALHLHLHACDYHGARRRLLPLEGARFDLDVAFGRGKVRFSRRRDGEGFRDLEAHSLEDERVIGEPCAHTAQRLLTGVLDDEIHIEGVTDFERWGPECLWIFDVEEGASRGGHLWGAVWAQEERRFGLRAAHGGAPDQGAERRCEHQESPCVLPVLVR